MEGNNNELRYTVVHHGLRGKSYLCCVETHCYGERILGYFDMARSTAMPLTHDQATMICNLLRSDMPAHDLKVDRLPWELPG